MRFIFWFGLAIHLHPLQKKMPVKVTENPALGLMKSKLEHDITEGGLSVFGAFGIAKQGKRQIRYRPTNSASARHVQMLSSELNPVDRQIPGSLTE